MGGNNKPVGYLCKMCKQYTTDYHTGTCFDCLKQRQPKISIQDALNVSSYSPMDKTLLAFKNVCAEMHGLDVDARSRVLAAVKVIMDIR